MTDFFLQTAACAQINTEGGIIEKDGEGGRQRRGVGGEGRGGEAVRAAHLYRQPERRGRKRETNRT